MSIFKIKDVRVARRADGRVSAYISGLGTGAPVQFFDDPIRIALMLQVFNARRDCYWDTDGPMFMTSPAEWMPPNPNVKEGRVSGWEIRIPGAKGVQPELYLHLVDPKETRMTSGDPAAGWVRIQQGEAQMTVMLGLVMSRWCYYSSGELRNTNITEDLPA
jgi:hypothetical protein